MAFHTAKSAERRLTILIAFSDLESSHSENTIFKDGHKKKNRSQMKKNLPDHEVFLMPPSAHEMKLSSRKNGLLRVYTFINIYGEPE